MKAEDLRTKSADELKAQLLDLKKEQMNLRFQKANGQLEGTSRIRTVRRDIARIYTIMDEAETTTTKKTAGKAKKAAGGKT